MFLPYSYPVFFAFLHSLHSQLPLLPPSSISLPRHSVCPSCVYVCKCIVHESESSVSISCAWRIKGKKKKYPDECASDRKYLSAWEWTLSICTVCACKGRQRQWSNVGKPLRSMVYRTQPEISDNRISNMSHIQRQRRRRGVVFSHCVIAKRHNRADWL